MRAIEARGLTEHARTTLFENTDEGRAILNEIRRLANQGKSENRVYYTSYGKAIDVADGLSELGYDMDVEVMYLGHNETQFRVTIKW